MSLSDKDTTILLEICDEIYRFFRFIKPLINAECKAFDVFGKFFLTILKEDLTKLKTMSVRNEFVNLFSSTSKRLTWIYIYEHAYKSLSNCKSHYHTESKKSISTLTEN